MKIVKVSRKIEGLQSYNSNLHLSGLNIERLYDNFSAWRLSGDKVNVAKKNAGFNL